MCEASNNIRPGLRRVVSLNIIGEISEHNITNNMTNDHDHLPVYQWEPTLLSLQPLTMSEWEKKPV